MSSHQLVSGQVLWRRQRPETFTCPQMWTATLAVYQQKSNYSTLFQAKAKHVFHVSEGLTCQVDRV